MKHNNKAIVKTAQTDQHATRDGDPAQRSLIFTKTTFLIHLNRPTHSAAEPLETQMSSDQLPLLPPAHSSYTPNLTIVHGSI